MIFLFSNSLLIENVQIPNLFPEDALHSLIVHSSARVSLRDTAK